MPTSRLLVLLVLAILSGGPALALDWAATTLDARAEPFQKSLTLVFKFKNDRATPTHILDLRTSCSCLAARSDKNIYAPGETGTITAEFSTEEPPGIYERQIQVITDDTTTEPQRLTVRIDLPELAWLAPRSLEWRVSTAATEKSLEIRANGNLRIAFTQATPTNESFAVRLETIEPEKLYRLVVTPRSTAAVANTAIRITGRDSTGHEILVSAYANVR